MIIQIEPNAYCAAVEMRVFNEAGPPQAVAQVRLEREPGRPAWYEVDGWTLKGEPCPAYLQKVDDSGEGVAFLLYGGDAGVRFRPAEKVPGRPDPWWEPFLILADPNDVR